MVITQAAAAKLGKHIYDMFETEMLIKIERSLEQLAREKGIPIPEHTPTDEQCAKQICGKLCKFYHDCDEQRKRDIRGEEEMKAI